MKTRYQVGQRVWYVDCFAYPTGPSKSVCYYRPFRAVICDVKIQQFLYWRQKRKTNYQVKYGVFFDSKERNRGYQQQNENIFARYENALEWARLTNELCDSRKQFETEEERYPTARRILREMKQHRKKEPIEPNCYSMS